MPLWEHGSRWLDSAIGLAHYIGMALDAYRKDADKEALSGSKAGSFALNLIKHLPANSPAACKETQLDNPYTAGRRKTLLDALREHGRFLCNGSHLRV